jgi:hypothetical protein
MRYKGLLDMLNGGGPGTAGPGGYTSLADMFNGGGAGRAGQQFEGDLFSGLLNALGIRPAGYMDRLAEARPMARPAGLGAAPRPAPPQPMMPPIDPYAAGAVTTSALPPPGSMANEDLMRLLRAAVAQTNSYGGNR